MPKPTPTTEATRLARSARDEAFVRVYDRVVRYYWAHSEITPLSFEDFRAMVEAEGLTYPALVRS